MNNKAQNTVKRFDMLQKGDNVVVGVSGGADSMALLRFLHSNKDIFGISVTACHVNHGLRGEEADRDERFVTDYCNAHNIECRVIRADVNARAQRDGMGTEEAGRAVRYEFFNSIGSEKPPYKIATAHTLSDSAETVLINMLRGTGINGLAGIPPVRDNVIRPLIECTREDVELYCRENGLKFVTDSTNLTDCYLRNKLRHAVIPVLRDCNGDFYSSLSKMTEILREDSEYLAAVSKDAYDRASLPDALDISQIKNEHVAVLSRVVMNFFRDNSITCDRLHVDQTVSAIRKGDGCISVGGDRTVVIGKNKMTVCNVFKRKEGLQFALSENETAHFDGKTVKTESVDKEKLQNLKKINRLLLKNYIDCDRLVGDVVLRQRKEGDSIKLHGRGVTKSLKKLLSEANIDHQKRWETVVICDCDGVIWVEGFGCAERVSISDKTQRAFNIIIDVEKGKGEQNA